MNPLQDISSLFTLHGLASLVVLSLLELILGVDNIIFISLVIAKLPEQKRLAARITGLSLALLMRLLMLWGLVWLSHIASALFTISGFVVTTRDVLFFVGGAYLIYNTGKEMIELLRKKIRTKEVKKQMQFSTAIMQIVMVDVLFSFDSIFTAIGLAQSFVIMALAIVIGMMCMLLVSGKISAFINKYRNIKVLSLGFIIAIGVILIVSAFHIEFPKKYIYVAFFAAFAVELVRIKKPTPPSHKGG